MHFIKEVHQLDEKELSKLSSHKSSIVDFRLQIVDKTVIDLNAAV